MYETKGEVCPKLILSISGIEGRIRIGTSIPKVLGNPEYICIYVSAEREGMLVRPCDEKEYLSVAVMRKDGRKVRDELRIYSHRFVSELFARNDWDMSLSYQMQGEYSARMNAVMFDYRRAEVQ